jgi:hypothetical protein
MVFSTPALAGPLTAGSQNEAVIDPNVTVPNETPCVVPLVTNAKFGADQVNYSFTPPSACPGPWAKVVLVMHIGLNAGVQYDRSGELIMAGVPIWFGTTAEPSPNLGPNWTFEKDVTDDTALFTTAQTGFLEIANYQSKTYNSTITADATLSFFPATTAYPAPPTADKVLPLPGTGGIATLNGPTNPLSTTLTLPTNILHATLDLYLQGQSGDEFWYSCVPNSLTTQLESCGGGALREGEITVDTIPAGVAPVFPWIFTGGIDPELWAPIPGVQTLDFTAFHIDLSPFAGLLSNGASHTIAASVYGDNGYFSATGALRLFLDHGATTVSGKITTNTLAAAPSPSITQNVSTTALGTTLANVVTRDRRAYVIEGTVTGSAGTTTNRVQQTSDFANRQIFSISDTKYVQNITQTTNITTTTTSTTGKTSISATKTLSYPLSVDITELTPAIGNITQTTSIDQNFLESDTGTSLPPSTLADHITTADTLILNSSFELIGNSGQSETATYSRSGFNLPCFKRTLTAAANMLTGAVTGCGK